MATEITNNPEHERYEIAVDGELVGFVRYREHPGQIVFTHTEIDKDHGGQGLGGQLIRYALDDVRGRGLGVLPYCPFVKAFIAEHGEYLELVPTERRGRFGL